MTLEGEKMRQAVHEKQYKHTKELEDEIERLKNNLQVKRDEVKEQAALIKDHEARLRYARDDIHPGCKCSKCQALLRATVPECPACTRVRDHCRERIKQDDELRKTGKFTPHTRELAGEAQRIMELIDCKQDPQSEEDQNVELMCGSGERGFSR